MCALAWLSCVNSVEENHQKSNNVGVEMGVATRRAQMVWPMMTVTVTILRALLGSNFEKFGYFCTFLKDFA